DGWKISCDDGETLLARNLVLATGKWGIRGLTDTRDTSLVGLKMHLRLTSRLQSALADRVELTLLERSYAGLELVEDGLANLCFLLPRAVVSRLLTSTAPSLSERLAGAEPLWERAVAVVCPARGHLHNERKPAVYRVGDRLAHIPPFTGDGIAIALGSAPLAAKYIQRERGAAAYQNAARQLTRRPIQLASVVSDLAASNAGGSLLVGAATQAPGLIRAIVQRTRLPLAGLDMHFAQEEADPTGVRARRSQSF